MRYGDDRTRHRAADKVWRAIEDVANHHPRGDLLPTKEVRARAKVPKDAFDRAVLDLAELGRLVLHHHDGPHMPGITDAMREAWVFDLRGETQGRPGTYYIGLSPRYR